MSESAAFLHELTLEGSAETESELDDWIAGFLDDIRAQPGFDGADAWTLDAGPDSGKTTGQDRTSTRN